MHPQGTDEVPLHQPEGLGQQQRPRHLLGHAVHHLPPELVRHRRVELRLGHRRLRPRRNRAAAPRHREPQPLHMPPRQRHRRVEADNRKQPGHLQNGLDHLLPHRRAQVVQLRGVVPREARAVVAVVDVVHMPAPVVAPAKDHGRVRLLVVVVLDLDLHASIVRQIGPLEPVGRIRRVRPRQKPLRMLDHPGRVDAHMVRHHVARQPDPPRRRPVPQVHIGGLATQVRRHIVRRQRIRRRHRLRLPA